MIRRDYSQFKAEPSGASAENGREFFALHGADSRDQHSHSRHIEVRHSSRLMTVVETETADSQCVRLLNSPITFIEVTVKCERD
jgi:hypothetical protein